MSGIKGSKWGQGLKYNLSIEEYRQRNIKQNKEILKKMRKEDPKKYRLRRLLYFSRVRAKILKCENTLTYEWLEKNTKEKCPKCNVPFSYDLSIHRNPFAPSIDRMDRTKGYTPDNCQMVSWIYNNAKGPLDEKILYRICKAL